MAMTDITFILLFLPTAFLALLFKPHWQKYILLLLSLFYYACGSPGYFVLLLALLIINVVLAYVIQKIIRGGDIIVFNSYNWNFIKYRSIVLLQIL